MNMWLGWKFDKVYILVCASSDGVREWRMHAELNIEREKECYRMRQKGIEKNGSQSYGSG